MASDSQSDSLETSSNSVVEHSLNIKFERLTYSVKVNKYNIFSGARKEILRDVNGSFNAGELSVIMGQSGAGKTTLMDILAGYTKETSGLILVNGRPRDLNKFRRRSCYILQDDAVQNLLTVHESITIAAELKLGSHVSRLQKKQRVGEVIVALDLGLARNTRAGNLSGGQKKRLAIGLELVSDPPVMFLDEPTSGLDSSLSKQMIYLLYLLARQGRTVVVSMHQPSAGLLQMVDCLYAVVAGRCAYMGSVPNLISFLKLVHIPCPPYHTPVDYLIEKSAEHERDLVAFSQNGTNTSWISSVSQETDKVIEHNNSSTFNEIFLTNLPTPKEDPTTKILLALKSTYSTSQWKQFYILTKRALLATWRDPALTYTIVGIHCAMAFFVGSLFWNINYDAKNIMNNYRFLFFSLMFLMFTSFSSVIVHFPEQIHVVRREHFNRWYSAGAYYSSTVASYLPTQTICTLSFTCLTYWMTGQMPNVFRFTVYASTLLLVSYAALSVGLLNGSLFNTKNAVIFGPLMIMPFTVFSGFFLHYNDAHYLMKWLFHSSFLKHGFVGLILSTYGFNRTKITPCTDMYCHYSSPTLLLKDISMDHEDISTAIYALIGTIIIVTLTAYALLKIRLKLKW